MSAPVTVLHGDCLDVLRTLPDSSIDAIVTDPPYGLGFMGKAWDDLPPGLPWAQECLRVLKPGGHLLAFGGTRTWHRLATAVEDAGFEIRDSIAWLYGSGFPKSLDVSKAVEATLTKGGSSNQQMRQAAMGDDYAPTPGAGTPGYGDVGNFASGGRSGGTPKAFVPTTDEAAQWSGWGTALKPAFEPIVVGRKPLVGTVAANVLAHGTGALNIDATRVGNGSDKGIWPVTDRGRDPGWGMKPAAETDATKGRWPANVLLDGDMADELDEQSGITKSTVGKTRGGGRSGGILGKHVERADKDVPFGFDDSGGASRFFPTFRYQAKAPTRERPSYERAGEGESRVIAGTVKQCSTCGSKTITSGAGGGPACGHGAWEHVPVEKRSDRVAHPTVKPLDLMRWLVRLVTPPGGTVLDPFAGSGTTVEACILEGVGCIAIEREADYLPLIAQRIARHAKQPAPQQEDGLLFADVD